MKYVLIVLFSFQVCYGQNIIYTQGFGNGIPSTWSRSATSQGSPNSGFKFNYRGPNTTPNCTVGSTGFVAQNGTIGSLSSSQSVISSLTPSNGFVILDPDAASGYFTWNFGGWHFGPGLAPAPHTSVLKTHYFNFQCYDSVQLKFNQFYRHHSGQTFVDISVDKGATWHANQINMNMSTSTQTPNNSVVTINIGNIIAGQDSVLFRFRYQDNVNMGWGGYFWMIDDIKIINYSKPFSVTRPNNGVICDGDSILVQAPSNRTNYQWSTGDTLGSVYLNQGGTYSLISSDQCGIDTVVFNISQSNSPLVQISCGNSTTLCQGDTLNVSATGAGTYLWSNGGFSGAQSFTTSGRHYVIGYDSTGFCRDTVEFDVNVHPNPNLSIIGQTLVCPGDSALWTVFGASAYLWNSGDTNSTFWVKNAGLYSVVGLDTAGCSSIATKQLTIDHPDTLLSASGGLGLCPGASVKLEGSSGQDYLWNTGDSTQSITITQAGSYFAIVTTLNGCIDTTETYTFTVYSDPDTNVAVTGNLSFCPGGSVTLNATAGQSYLWSNGDTTQSITTTQSGTYYAIITTADGCSDTTAQFSTTAFVGPNTTITASQTTICASDSTVITAAAGYSYLWNTGDTTQSITTSNAGTYSVTLTTLDGCIDSSASMVIAVVPDLVLPLIIGNTWGWFGQGDTTNLSTATNASYTLNWVVNGGTILSGQGTDNIQVVWGGPDSTAVVWLYIDNGGCMDSTSIQVIISGIGTDERAIQDIRLFPNPNDGFFTLQVSDAFVGGYYEIVDGMGRPIEMGEIQSKTQDVDLAEKPKGVYRITLTGKSNSKTMVVVLQ